MIHYFRERGHRADLDAIGGRANSAQFLDSTQIDHGLGLFNSILEPVEAVEPSGQNPGVASLLFEKPLSIGNRAWLIQLESSHYISYDSHKYPSNLKYGPSEAAASAGQLPATSELCRRSPERAEKSRPRAHPRARSKWKRSRPQRAARPHPGRPRASPGPEYPARSIACRREHRESSAVCSGRSVWKPSVHSADRTPTSGRSHGQCRASNGRALGRRAPGDESPFPHQRRRENPRRSTCLFRHRLQPRRSWPHTKTWSRRVDSYL